MKRCNALVFAALLVAGLSTSATSRADAAQPVFKIDSVTASVAAGAPHKLVINAKGAVRTGGWENPRLRVKQITVPESDTMTVIFVALPPPPTSMVVEAILPVQATITVPMPKGHITTVKVASETNSVSAKIGR